MMQSTRLFGMVLVAAMWMSFSPSIARADVVAWSTNAAACVPVSASGLSVTAGAVTAGAGATVTLYCGIDKSPGGFDTIEITYKGGAGLGNASVGGSNAPVNVKRKGIAAAGSAGSVTSELIAMAKATGVETVRCGIQPSGSSGIASARNLCNNSELDFQNNFYYLRIVLKSGILAGQVETVYGSSLVSTR
jgi:hypothetical protein